MKKDLFANECKNPIIFALIAVVIIANLLPEPIEHIIEALFMLTLGILCIYNFNRCGRFHCRITGYGFLAAGLLGILILINIIKVDWNATWIIFIASLIIGYGLEYFYKRKQGTCYKKK